MMSLFRSKLSPSSVSWGDGAAVVAGIESSSKARAMKRQRESMPAVKRRFGICRDEKRVREKSRNKRERPWRSSIP